MGSSPIRITHQLFKGLVDMKAEWKKEVSTSDNTILPSAFSFLLLITILCQLHCHFMTISHIIINPLNSTIMSARQQAEQDIKESLRIQGKCFLAFRSELNPIMDKLVEKQLKAQESL